MKTIIALKKYKLDSALTGAAIAKQLGLKPRLINAWLNDENLPCGENLLFCQELLVEKGYSLEELREFPDCLKIIRRFFFKGSITFEDVRKEFSLSDSGGVRKLLVYGKLSAPQKGVCLAYASKLLESLKEKEENTSSDSGAVSLVGTVSMILLGSLRKFLIISSPAERQKIRQSNPGLFDASNILSAFCSEKAFERWAQENKS